MMEGFAVSKPNTFQSRVMFGEDFELDFQLYKLRRAGRILKLERIPMEILRLLVEHRGQVVTREEIAAQIWGSSTFIDTDNSINGAIRKIRHVLRDNSEQPRFIQTITGKGYRFIAPVIAQEQPGTPEHATDTEHLPSAPAVVGFEAEPVLFSSQMETAADRPSSISEAMYARPRRRNINWIVFVSVLGLVSVASVALFAWWASGRPRPFAGKIMLAVLPFENLTGDPGEDYFSDGLTEEMITQLGNVDPQHLGVIARTSVMHFKNSREPWEQIGRELGVQYVIEGSVRRDANTVRITAQLIQTRDQTHIWARQYDRELKGTLSLQGEIAQEIADEMELTLGKGKPASSSPASPQATNYQAYDLYLKGQYFFNKRTAADLKQALGYFQQAVAKDPHYARAYAGMADCYALMGGYSGYPQTEFMPQARAAALRALQIDDRLAEAHTALALIVQNYDRDWPTAEKEFRRAIELDPNYATAHHWYAEHLMWRGRFDEALQESERARQLDPLSLIIAADNGEILFFSRQYDLAIDKWRSVQEMNPDFLRAHLIMDAYVEKGMFPDAIAEADRLRPITSESVYWSSIAYIYGRSGESVKANAALRKLLALERNHPGDPYFVALAYLGSGNNKEVLLWLEKAYLEHSGELLGLNVNPDYDRLRGDPRFQDLLHRLNFP
jgi:TolB-like protein/DNA-binding winged helix-turn-helix (wHTH) protein/Tfp pilus assembly protein PilF